LFGQPGQTFSGRIVHHDQGHRLREVVDRGYQISKNAAFADENRAIGELPFQLGPPIGLALKDRNAGFGLNSGHKEMFKKERDRELTMDDTSFTIFRNARTWDAMKPQPARINFEGAIG
jgi:hypothetical protein